MQTKNILFTEYPLNELLTLKNRIVMAPMTRAKADAAFVPTKAMADYYARRADAERSPHNCRSIILAFEGKTTFFRA